MSILKDFDKIYDYSHMWNWGLDWIAVTLVVKLTDLRRTFIASPKLKAVLLDTEELMVYFAFLLWRFLTQVVTVEKFEQKQLAGVVGLCEFGVIVGALGFVQPRGDVVGITSVHGALPPPA